ncbi:hypothetical protein [Dyadobacter sp. MSC1_007]|jgi:hypothetical protein|uniref:hypothetical protein n=1 Tax=Dyadobacter sp. MSC1_007 TaxID=2909264 RepID=UPI00202F0BE9|nr:hypothetical protein [Dyadobacter sp. MSC1_007]
MFSPTPWTDYFIAVAALLAVYYILFAFKFYGGQIKAAVISGGTNWWRLPRGEPAGMVEGLTRQGAGFETSADKVQAPQAPVSQERVAFEQIVGLGNQLTALIEEANQQSYDATELSLLLQMVLQDYPLVHEKAFRISINEFIDNQCAKYGSVHLSERDKAVIWDQV